MTPLLGTALLLFNGSKILLAERISSHENGRFGCPGGKVDFGENPTTAITRELYEETRIVLAPKAIRPVGLISSCVYPLEQRHFLCIWYFAKYSGPTPTHIENDAKGEPKSKGWGWYGRLELRKMPLMLSTLDAVLYLDSTKRGKISIGHRSR